MSAWTCRATDGKAAVKIVPPRPRIPYWKGLGADSEEKHEPASDIALVDSLKVLDPEGPIREDCSASSSDPILEGPWCRFRREARARERHRHHSRGQSDVLDPGRPIREADINHHLFS